LFSLLS